MKTCRFKPFGTGVVCPIVILLCGWAGAENRRACSPDVHGKPNMVIILADDLGYGDVSCDGGSIKTPNIDLLAKHGLRFTDFHSNGCVCSPTRCALMTGRYQNRAGIAGLVRGEGGMDPKEFTIAEAMKSVGYATAMFGKWHLGQLPEFNPTKQGFDEYKGFLGGRIDYFTHLAAGKPHNPDWWNGVEPLMEKGYSTTLIGDHSVDFIKRSKSKPFFLYVAFNSPHTPIQDPVTGEQPKDAETYAKVVQWMDMQIGRIVDTLKEQGLAENTMVFFCSDNGAHNIQGASNKPLNGWKGSYWEGGMRVPGIACWPGHIDGSGMSGQTAMTIDLMPTCMELAGADLPSGHTLDGVSLVPLLLGNKPLFPRKLFWNQGRKSAMRDGAWKLFMGKTTVHLFNLDRDLSEQNDLAAQQPERLKAMQAEFKHWLEDVQAGQTEKVK